MEEKKEVQEYIDFLHSVGVLRLGSFKLKSGRNSPYFFNMGRVNSGSALLQIGRIYARSIRSAFGEVNNIFGPAYKGITLAAAAAIGFDLEFGEKVFFCYDRKEAKKHGESGGLVGAVPQEGQRVVIVDDVITTGGTKYEAVEMLKSFDGIEIVGLMVGMDRMEVGDDGVYAAEQFSKDTGVPVHSIANVHDVIGYLKEKKFDHEIIKSMEDYISKYSS